MKRGFTLVELLATLILISAIGFMSLVGLNKQVKKTDEGAYTEYINTINLATKSYITSNEDNYPEYASTGTFCINLNDVVMAGYLSSKLKNPKNEAEVIKASNTVTLDSHGKYSYIYSDTLCQ